MPNATATSDAGTAGANRRQPNDYGERDNSHGQCSPLRFIEVAEEVPRLFEEVAVPFSNPNTLGSCPTMIVSASPMMKPFMTGSEMKLARKPRRNRPASNAMVPVDQREHRGERQEVVRSRRS